MKTLARFKLGLRLFDTEEYSTYQTLVLLVILIAPAAGILIMVLGIEGSKDIITSLIVGAFLYISLLTIGFIYYLGGEQKVTAS